MTENEFLKYVDDVINWIDVRRKQPLILSDLGADTAVKALKEYKQYRAIGTVEECREARERQREKKPIMKPFFEDMEEEYLCCPNCGNILTDRIPADKKDFYFHCLNCGQKFDWSDTPWPTK